MVELELLPAADARHQFDAEQIRKREDVRGLAVRVRVQPGGAQIAEVAVQDVEDVGGFIDPAADKAAEECDVVIGDVVVGDPAVAAVPS